MDFFTIWKSKYYIIIKNGDKQGWKIITILPAMHTDAVTSKVLTASALSKFNSFPTRFVPVERNMIRYG